MGPIAGAREGNSNQSEHHKGSAFLATAKAICKDYRSLHNVEIDRVPDEDG
jgi:hypothetical protein